MLNYIQVWQDTGNQLVEFKNVKSTVRHKRVFCYLWPPPQWYFSMKFDRPGVGGGSHLFWSYFQNKASSVKYVIYHLYIHIIYKDQISSWHTNHLF